MPDEPGASPGNPPVVDPAARTDGVPDTGVGNTDTGAKVVLGKHEFKSIEDAGKSYEESVRALNLKAEEAATLRKELEATRAQAAQADILKTIAANTAKPEPVFDFEAHVKALAEKYDVSEDYTRELLATQSGWLAESERKSEERAAAVEALIAKQTQELRAEQQRLRPDYLENKERVDRFTANGMQFEAAVAEAKAIRAQLAPEHPDRVEPPTTVSNNRTPSGLPDATPYLTPEDRATLKRTDGLTDEQLNEMEADYHRRVARQAREAELLATGGAR